MLHNIAMIHVEVDTMFKILIVEDDKDLNRSVCSFLNQSGYEATGCLNANDAYDAMYETMFDLILSDIMMPGIDGYEFVKTVRSLNHEIPILFMTAKDDIYFLPVSASLPERPERAPVKQSLYDCFHKGTGNMLRCSFLALR